MRTAPQLCLSVIILLGARTLPGQQLEPQAYSVSPVGVNAAVFAFSTMDGDLSFAPTVPLENVTTKLNLFNFGYFRSINFFGRSGSITAILPYTEGTTEGLVSGEFQRVRRSGLRDPAVRLAVNLHGAPAMALKDFASFQQKWIVGASLVVAAPLGQYDPARLINTGTNRWSFKPEIGVSRTIKRWTLEFAGGAWLFTPNNNFMGRKRTQKPIGAGQIHVIYTFKPRLWLSFDTNFYTGGRTSVDGVPGQDLQRNSRLGVTGSIPLAKRHSIKAAFSDGARTTIGADFHSISLAYQFIWGGGL